MLKVDGRGVITTIKKSKVGKKLAKLELPNKKAFNEKR